MLCPFVVLTLSSLLYVRVATSLHFSAHLVAASHEIMYCTQVVVPSGSSIAGQSAMARICAVALYHFEVKWRRKTLLFSQPFSSFFFLFLSILVQNPHRRRVEFGAYCMLGSAVAMGGAAAGEAAAPAAAAPAGGGLVVPVLSISLLQGS